MKFSMFIFVMSVVFILFSLAIGSGEKIPWWSLNAGGNIYSSSTNHALCGSSGQLVAGEGSSIDNHSYAGFWNPWLMQTSTDVEDEQNPTLPAVFSISQNYPNPFNPQTIIEYSLPEVSHVNIAVFNILGQKVKVLKDEVEGVGYKMVTWDGKDESGSEVASGIYFYRIQAKDFAKCKKMLLLK